MTTYSLCKGRVAVEVDYAPHGYSASSVVMVGAPAPTMPFRGPHRLQEEAVIESLRDLLAHPQLEFLVRAEIDLLQSVGLPLPDGSQLELRL